MNKTAEYFAKYYETLETGEQALEALRESLKNCKDGLLKKQLREKIAKLEQRLESDLISAAKKAMNNAIISDEYNLTVDDIKDILDCDDRFVADYILEHVDYIDVPKYSGHFFNNNLQYSCIDQIRLIWKKVFISKSSFIEYLLSNASLNYVYFRKVNNKLVKLTEEAPVNKSLVEFIIAEKTLFKRRCNLDHVIMNVKFASFVERIVNKYDELFKKALLNEHLEEIDVMRLAWELEDINQLTPERLRLKVRAKEITDYIQQHAHVELIINCPATAPRMALRSDLEGRVVDGKGGTSTTLYSLNCVLVEDHLKKLDSNYGSVLERFK